MGQLGESLSPGGLIAVTWSGVALAAIFLVGRITLRAHKYHKITHADDCLM